MSSFISIATCLGRTESSKRSWVFTMYRSSVYTQYANDFLSFVTDSRKIIKCTLSQLQARESNKNIICNNDNHRIYLFIRISKHCFEKTSNITRQPRHCVTNVVYHNRKSISLTWWRISFCVLILASMQSRVSAKALRCAISEENLVHMPAILVATNINKSAKS